MGGRLPLSASLGKVLRSKFDEASSIGNKQQAISKSTKKGYSLPIELSVLKPLFDLQAKLSHVPKENELLIEQIETRDGFHLFV